MTLTREGFQRKRLAEIKADYDRRMTTALGPVNVKPDSVVGVLNGIFAETLDSVYEMLQDNHDSMYPATAEGTSLDGAVSFVGLQRLPATATIVTAVAYGVEGTIIPEGSIARADIQYRSTSNVLISRSNALDIEFEVLTVAENSAYQILLGPNSYTYNTGTGPSRSSILSGIRAAIDPAQFVATVVGDRLRVYSEDLITPFAATLDSKFRMTKRGSPVVFVASETGAFGVPVGGLSTIGTPINGWDSVYNLAPGDIGRDLETDAELRARHALSVRATGSATVEAIKSRMLQEVAGVTNVQIYENRTAVVSSDGIPPHAFESVIIGGTNSEVARQLWITKPAGIETHGNVTVTVQDSFGDPQTIKFSRAVDKFVWFRVTVQALNAEESLPVGADALIRNAIVEYGRRTVGVGDDLIVQKFYGPIYEAVAGLGKILVEMAVTDSLLETPVYSENNVTVGKPEGPIFSAETISVIGI